MAGALIGALRVTLGIDTAAFNDGLSIAQKRLADAGKRMQAVGDSMAGVGARMSMVMAPVVAALGTATKAGLDYASALGEQAQQLGVTTDHLQEYRYAASQAGVEQEEMDKSLAKLTQNLGKAAGGAGPAAKAFAEMGINIRDSQGNIKLAGDLMPEIADALAKIPDPARRAALEIALFGKSGQKLDTMLSGGAAGLNELRNAAHELGIVLSSSQIAKADEAADKLGAVKQVLGAKLAGIVAENSDAIVNFATGLGNALSKVLDAFNNLSPGTQTFIAGLTGLAVAAGPVLMAVGTLVSGIGSVLPAFSGITALFTSTGAAASAAGTGMATAGGALGSVGGAAGGLSAILAPLLPIIAAVGAAGVVLYTQWDKIQPVLAKVAAGMQEALGPKVAALVETFKSAMVKLQPLFDAIGETIAGFLKIMGPIWTATFASVIDIVTGFISVFTDIFSGFYKLFTGDFNGAMDSFKSAARTGLDVVLKIFGNFWTATKSIFANFGVNLVQIGKDMIAGLVRGIAAAGPMVAKALMNVVSAGVSGVKSFLGIRSPSRLFMEMGGFVAAGFAIGITDGTKQVVDAVTKMAKAASFTMSKELKAALNALSDEAQPIIDRLFPEDAKRRQFAADKATIARAPNLSAVQKVEAQRRLQEEYLADFAGAVFDKWQVVQDKKVAGITKQFTIVGKAAQKDLQNPVERAVTAMANVVSQAAQSIGNAVRNIGDAFKGGGFWDKLGALADLISVGAQAYGNVAGLFSGGAAAKISSALKTGALRVSGGRANGGPVLANHAYMVGEKRPEMFVPSTAGRIDPKPSNDNAAGVRVHVELTDTTGLFETRVTQTAAAVTASGIGALESKRRFAMSRNAP